MKRFVLILFLFISSVEILNAATPNSDPIKVACIYADAPVLDGKSWPGGFGKGKGYPDGWEEFKSIYKLSSEKKEQKFKGDPIHKTKKITKGEFPIMHVCSITDKVVPIDENTKIFEEKLNGSTKILSPGEFGSIPERLIIEENSIYDWKNNKPKYQNNEKIYHTICDFDLCIRIRSGK